MDKGRSRLVLLHLKQMIRSLVLIFHILSPSVTHIFFYHPEGFTGSGAYDTPSCCSFQPSLQGCLWGGRDQKQKLYFSNTIEVIPSFPQFPSQSLGLLLPNNQGRNSSQDRCKRSSLIVNNKVSFPLWWDKPLLAYFSSLCLLAALVREQAFKSTSGEPLWKQCGWKQNKIILPVSKLLGVRSPSHSLWQMHQK